MNSCRDTSALHKHAIPLLLYLHIRLIRLPPPPPAIHFPYTTLFRSTFDADKVQAYPPGSLVVLPGETWQNDEASRRSEEHTSELQLHSDLVWRFLLEIEKALLLLLDLLIEWLVLIVVFCINAVLELG